MSKNMIFAGFGGQGIQFAAKVMAYAGMIDEKAVSLLPSYGPEMRGGTSNCAVCIDESPIASPLVNEPTHLFVMNEPSYAKFINLVAPNGAVVFDNSLISSQTERDNIKLFSIPATNLANENKLTGLANMIALGYMVKKTNVISFDLIKQAILKIVPASKQALIDKNLTALDIGYQYEA